MIRALTLQNVGRDKGALTSLQVFCDATDDLLVQGGSGVGKTEFVRCALSPWTGYVPTPRQTALNATVIVEDHHGTQINLTVLPSGTPRRTVRREAQAPIKVTTLEELSASVGGVATTPDLVRLLVWSQTWSTRLTANRGAGLLRLLQKILPPVDLRARIRSEAELQGYTLLPTDLDATTGGKKPEPVPPEDLDYPTHLLSTVMRTRAAAKEVLAGVDGAYRRDTDAVQRIKLAAPPLPTPEDDLERARKVLDLDRLWTIYDTDLAAYTAREEERATATRQQAQRTADLEAWTAEEPVLDTTAESAAEQALLQAQEALIRARLHVETETARQARPHAEEEPAPPDERPPSPSSPQEDPDPNDLSDLRKVAEAMRDHAPASPPSPVDPRWHHLSSAVHVFDTRPSGLAPSRTSSKSPTSAPVHDCPFCRCSSGAPQ